MISSCHFCTSPSFRLEPEPRAKINSMSEQLLGDSCSVTVVVSASSEIAEVAEGKGKLVKATALANAR